MPSVEMLLQPVVEKVVLVPYLLLLQPSDASVHASVELLLQPVVVVVVVVAMQLLPSVLPAMELLPCLQESRALEVVLPPETGSHH